MLPELFISYSGQICAIQVKSRQTGQITLEGLKVCGIQLTAYAQTFYFVEVLNLFENQVTQRSWFYHIDHEVCLIQQFCISSECINNLLNVSSS